MEILRACRDRCEKCNSNVDRVGFQIADGKGSTYHLCLAHVIEELKLCCDHLRVVGPEN